MTTFNLDEPILRIGKNQIDWTIRNSVEGLQIFGGIGSGKTSGSGRFFALKYLSKAYGGLVLTAKHDEKDEWVKYCELANRENDLIIVEPNGKHYFNFLDYESRKNTGQFYTDNILQVLKTVIRASEEKSQGKSDDPFWETALDMLISNTLDLCFLAYDKISVELLYNIAYSAVKAQSKKEDDKQTAFDEAFTLANEKLAVRAAKWEAQFTLDELTAMSNAEYEQGLFEAIPEVRTIKYVNSFFTDTYANLSEKTRSIIDFSFIGFLFRLLKNPVYSLFCNKPSTFTPEDCLQGKIIVINLPVKIYHKVGQDVQIMFKYIWQRAMESRNVQENGRPVFLWADESQNFLHEYDPDYQATARSSRIATVYISQNIPNYYANMGGMKAEYKVKSFLGTLATKVFHANADIETNKYASELIGEGYQREETEARNTTDGKVSVTQTMSSKLAKIVRPEQFQTLKTGGEKNDMKVGSYIHIQGMKLLNDASYEKILFNQNFEL